MLSKLKQYTDNYKFNYLKEGKAFNIDKDILDDQKILEVGAESSDKAEVEKTDKQSFEEFKTLYKGAIDDKCKEEYGSTEDTSLWEDTAKEMFLQSKDYIPQEDMKPEGELDDKLNESYTKKEEHNKSSLTESDEDSESGIENTFRNYKAYLNNGFEPLDIYKENGCFYVYREGDKQKDTPGNYHYFYMGETKEQIEGWLYGIIHCSRNVVRKIK